MSVLFTRRSKQRSTTRESPEWRYPSIKPRRFNPTPTSVVSQKSLDHRGGLLSGSNGGWDWSPWAQEREGFASPNREISPPKGAGWRPSSHRLIDHGRK